MNRFKNKFIYFILSIAVIVVLLVCSINNNLSINAAGISEKNRNSQESSTAVKQLGATREVTLPSLQMRNFDTSRMNVVLNGKLLSFDVQPVIENGRTLVPVRAIFEALGMDVTWKNDTQTVTATDSENTITIKIGDYVLTTDGKDYALDVPAKVISNRTMVPLRAISESLGLSVDWFRYSSVTFINSGIKNLFYSDGKLEYKGQVNNAGEKNGFGKEYFEDGTLKYVGQWINGKKDGIGSYRWENSDTYEGDVTDGQPNGHGVLSHYSVGTYVGEFSSDMRSGNGTFTWLDGDKYVGSWANDKMDGTGAYTFADGTIWSGQWIANQFYG